MFAMSGGIASAFIRVEEIDRKLFVPFISKPFIGTVFGVGLCMFMSDGVSGLRGIVTKLVVYDRVLSDAELVEISKSWG